MIYSYIIWNSFSKYFCGNGKEIENDKRTDSFQQQKNRSHLPCNVKRSNFMAQRKIHPWTSQFHILITMSMRIHTSSS